MNFFSSNTDYTNCSEPQDTWHLDILLLSVCFTPDFGKLHLSKNCNEYSPSLFLYLLWSPSCTHLGLILLTLLLTKGSTSYASTWRMPFFRQSHLAEQGAGKDVVGAPLFLQPLTLISCILLCLHAFLPEWKADVTMNEVCKYLKPFLSFKT